jgi:hypothetical protein
MIQISKTKDKEIPTYLIPFVDYEKKTFNIKISEPKCLSWNDFFAIETAGQGIAFWDLFKIFSCEKDMSNNPTNVQ